MRERWLWLAGVSASAPVTVAVGWVVGHFAASSRSFDWIAATASATAAGTVSLAVVTGILAVMTAREVSYTAELERERHRPVLVVDKVSFLNQAGHRGVRRMTVEVLIANVGAGPALAVRVAATHPNPRVAVHPGPPIAYIAPGGEPRPAHLALVQQPNDTTQRFEDVRPEEFDVTVSCIDRLRQDVPEVLVPISRRA